MTYLIPFLSPLQTIPSVQGGHGEVICASTLVSSSDITEHIWDLLPQIPHEQENLGLTIVPSRFSQQAKCYVVSELLLCGWIGIGCGVMRTCTWRPRHPAVQA